MELADVPALLILAGVAAYIVFAGADFGAGLWYLLAGPGPRGRPIRDFTYHAMAPVWEANHVWLIFVLVVTWTAYPVAFGSIMSTLAVPLFIAALGIILRGTAYALRSGAPPDRETEGATGFVFGASSVLTPFALGAVIGGIASGRVPVGNAAGDLVSSWLNATSITIGAIAVATSGYLAAVYLTGDAQRNGEHALARAFRARALAMGVVAGVLAVAGLLVLRADARALFDDLTSGAGLVAVLVSAAGGLATIVLVRAERYEPARASAALAVAAIVAGWGLAQRPDLLPGLTIEEAAASHSTLVALLVATAGGIVVLAPSLTLLYGLVLRGRFDPAAGADEEPRRAGGARLRRAAGAPGPPGGAPRPLAGGEPRPLVGGEPRPLVGGEPRPLVAIALLVAGAALTLFGEGALLAVGVFALLGFVAVGAFELLRPEALEGGEPPRPDALEGGAPPRP